MVDKFNHVALTVPNYSYTFNFEKNFVYSDALTTITNHYPNCFYYSAIYVILIFTGKYYMSSRPKLELRGALALWNILLAVFSIFGFLRMSSEMYHVLSYYGFYHSVCVPSFLTQDPVTAFWSLLFILSKIVEFGDTAFIVLRKQPLMFLHWYHHITVFLYAWLCFIETTAYARWNAVVNFFVHSWMYSYYALKATRFDPPKWIAMMITTLQTVQMIWGCFVTIMAYSYVKSGQVECHVKLQNAKIGLLIYLSYFILFGRFFKQAYMSNKHGKKVGRKSDTNDKLIKVN
ncbi:elongation of very long chain fatty acids protein 6-like [Bombus affinis]|uniref:elongation of very long chain fatty acids protein 6-like n=1 Tax=Bombus affinis TaxID=309941 RepID=UPI0021B772F2|nr:elongation of very long chain fatty acids protein 6-like [Bombus affinis]XP_050593838.1 elongation of very long chain fatty acids protein 6-like [Bombus affinis]XP_050593839.1 elongation of very long chain fatty acids protein 6-like [Bombus affinis]